jgi:hypothetical protein
MENTNVSQALLLWFRITWLFQRCENSGRPVACMTCLMVAPICGYSVRHWLHVTFLASRMLRRLRGVSKICWVLVVTVWSYNTFSSIIFYNASYKQKIYFEKILNQGYFVLWQMIGFCFSIKIFELASRVRQIFKIRLREGTADLNGRLFLSMHCLRPTRHWTYFPNLTLHIDIRLRFDLCLCCPVPCKVPVQKVLPND